ncbi:SPW repeat domain-containing protein [Pontibacter sp. MBLB2868]|uniref:SPW repeat domain-containing protein n=1 Tax=Pontibacter sp. MBLB2868 TaxID=3451555 RepID=UPI003F74D5C5
MWAQIINAILGLWLMASPGIFGYQGVVADNNHIVGPIIASFAIISWWEATRVVRLYNLPLGFWLLLAPWVLGYESTTTIVNSMLVGVLVICFAFVKGKVEGTYGGGWKSLWQSDTLHQREARSMQDYADGKQ